MIVAPAPRTYTLSLHDALPILADNLAHVFVISVAIARKSVDRNQAFHKQLRKLDEQAVLGGADHQARSEEHTSELQSHVNLVCRLLLEKKKKQITDAIVLDCLS